MFFAAGAAVLQSRTYLRSIEDIPEIIDLEAEEAIESLEMEESEEGAQGEEENALEGDDEPECTMDTKEPAPTFLEALGHLDAFKRYCDANSVPRKVGESAVQELSRELQNHRLSIPTLNPTLFHYFPKK
jgi:hypothetical protein